LDESRRHDDNNYLDPTNTKKSYETVIRNWEEYCDRFNLRPRLDFSGDFNDRRDETIRLCNWMQWNTQRTRKYSTKLAMTSASSFLTYAYNLQAVHKREGYEWNITYEFHMMKKRLKRQYGWGGRRKLPLFITMVNTLERTGALILKIEEDETIITIMLMTIFGLMRISEVLNLEVGHAQLTKNKQGEAIVLTLRDSKTMKRNMGKPEIVMLVERSDNSNWCPCRLLKRLIERRRKRGLKGKLFDINRKQYSNRLKDALEMIGYDRELYDTHSGRIGGATMLWERGVPVDQIKAYGRWRSDCWQWYCRRLCTDYVKLSREIEHSGAISSNLVSQLVKVSAEKIIEK
jgi:hypothetical protein